MVITCHMSTQQAEIAATQNSSSSALAGWSLMWVEGPHWAQSANLTCQWARSSNAAGTSCHYECNLTLCSFVHIWHENVFRAIYFPKEGESYCSRLERAVAERGSAVFYSKAQNFFQDGYYNCKGIFPIKFWLSVKRKKAESDLDINEK